MAAGNVAKFPTVAAVLPIDAAADTVLLLRTLQRAHVYGECRLGESLAGRLAEIAARLDEQIAGAT